MRPITIRQIKARTPRTPPTIAPVWLQGLLDDLAAVGAGESVADEGTVESLRLVLLQQVEVAVGDDVDGVAVVTALAVVDEVEVAVGDDVDSVAVMTAFAVVDEVEVAVGDDVDGVAVVTAFAVVDELDEDGVSVGVVNCTSKCCVEAVDAQPR